MSSALSRNVRRSQNRVDFCSNLLARKARCCSRSFCEWPGLETGLDAAAYAALTTKSYSTRLPFVPGRKTLVCRFLISDTLSG